MICFVVFFIELFEETDVQNKHPDNLEEAD